MGKKGDTENLKSSLRIVSKNLKKFVVIYREKKYLRAYFDIFRSSRVLKRKHFLITDFSPFYSNGISRPFGGGSKPVNLHPLTVWNIFYYFFGHPLRSDTGEKVDSGSNEGPNVHGSS